jgi:hypothetical protein
MQQPNAMEFRRRTLREVGEVVFVDGAQRERICDELARSGFLVVNVEATMATPRGALCERLDEAIERELSARGGHAPGMVGGDRDATLGDQLYRARRLGASGLATVFHGLSDVARELGALDPRDSAFIRFLADATQERPVVLVLDERDGSAPAYANPVALSDVVAEALGRSPGPSERERASRTGRTRSEATAGRSALTTVTSGIAAPFAHTAHFAGTSQVAAVEPWRSWTLQLAAARGPLPLVELERLFAESYVPLSDAIARGQVDDPRARHAHEEFKTAFAKSYLETFPTLAATTKRPRMVLDVHDVAARLTRLHGARSTRLLMVDAMRWDLSRLVQEKVRGRLGPRAALTEELLLWSALPTTTLRQLETIARGVEALRSPSELDAEPQLPRGRTADYVRRLRVGPREVHKLDLVESRLQSLREPLFRVLPEIAEAAAEAITRHAETLPARTLLLVFGDHGFTVDRTGAVRQGGASPEEVLVGAFALLVGDVH